MLYLSEILLKNPTLESFNELVALVKAAAKTECFFSMDVKPQYLDTPSNWEEKLEAEFTGALDN